MHSRIKSAAAAGLVGAGALAAVALAAAPLPHTAKAYRTPAHKLGYKGITVIYVVSATSGTLLVPGVATLGSQDADSELFIDCPAAKRNPGLKATPFATVGFPGATLKLKHGKYGFTKVVTIKKQFVEGSPTSPFKLKLTITATVESASKIAGTVAARGGPCSTKKPVSYTAKLDPKAAVAPGQ